jgi:hypothetical protein
VEAFEHLWDCKVLSTPQFHVVHSMADAYFAQQKKQLETFSARQFARVCQSIATAKKNDVFEYSKETMLLLESLLIKDKLIGSLTHSDILAVESNMAVLSLFWDKPRLQRKLFADFLESPGDKATAMDLITLFNIYAAASHVNQD